MEAGMGIGHVIVVLMALGGFGISPNPNAPSAAEVLKYAPDEAETMAYLDVEAVVPGNYAAFTKLPADPAIAAVPGLAEEIRHGVQELEEMRQGMKQHAGVDVVTDLRSFAVFATFRGADRPPDPLFVVRTRIAPDVLDKAMAQVPRMRSEDVEGRKLWLPQGKTIVFTELADGTILGGAPDWVKARMSPKWKASAKKGTLADRSQAALDDKPFFFLASQPTQATVAMATQAMHGKHEAVLRDLVTGHEYASVSLSARGVGWTWVARDATGYARAQLASDGVIEFLRATHHAVRGLAELALAAIDSYAPYDKSVAQVMAHKSDVMKVVGTWSGDGNFAAKVDKKDSERRITVKLTGKSLSDVISIAGVMIPAGAAAAVFMRSHSVEVEPAPPAKIAPPVTKPSKK